MEYIARFLLFLFATILLHFGCVSEPRTVQPKVGSTYTYVHVRYDSLGRKIAGSEVFNIDTVIATGQSLYGKTQVMSITPLRGSGYLAYFNFEPNGDISQYFQKSSVWLTFPIQSHTLKSCTFLDTVYRGIVHSVSKADLSFEGLDTMFIHDSSLTVAKIKWFGIFKSTASYGSKIDTIIGYYYFAPSIGYIAKQRTEESYVRDVNPDEFILTKFTLK